MNRSWRFRELENVVLFVEDLLKSEDVSCPLTATIKQKSPEDYYVVNVIDGSDITSHQTGSEKQPTTSTTHRSGV